MNLNRRILALILTWLPALAHAWGSAGHQVVANLAEAQLTPKARTEVTRLLALEPGSTLASISTWADEHRNPSTAAWHYVNLPRESCTYVAERDCPNGQCVVAAIERQAAILASNAPDVKRLTALKYLVHLVGDIYQPLHAGFADDRGGNKYQIQAFGKGTNLHALWDSGLIDQLGMRPEELAKGLLSGSGRLASPSHSFPAVAEESCRIVAEPGFYPGRKVGAEYLKAYQSVLEQQLALAGARLAGMLNGIWR